MTSVLVVFLYPGEPAQLAAGTRGREMGQGGGGGSGGAGQGGGGYKLPAQYQILSFVPILHFFSTVLRISLQD